MLDLCPLDCDPEVIRETMPKVPVEIDLPLWADRYLPAEIPFTLAKRFADSGVVDYVQGWDQLTSWWPSHLWTPENSPHAAVAPDADSFPDWVSLLSAAAAVAPGLGTSISLDSIRRGPAELMQTMLTMSNITQGRSMFHFGAGEIKQTKPFGYKRSQGLGRLEDMFRLFHLFLEKDEPFDFEGNYWTYDQATIGQARPHRPQFWGLGGGPKILDLSTSYADGFATMAPMVATSPDHWAEWIASMKEDLERKGRDPEAFTFGIYATVLLHEDGDVIDAGLANPLLRWVTAIMGRIIQSDWDREGIEPPLPRDWHYAMKLLPKKLSAADVESMTANVTDEMGAKSYMRGNPAEVAAQLEPWVEAGASWVHVIDMLPPTLELDDAAQAPGRGLETARRLKGA